jgi:hypothetical protein
MNLRLEPADGGRLLGFLSDEDGEHVISSSAREEALADLNGALDDLQSLGSGECYWSDEASAYRWLLRRENGRVRLAVLRLTGVVPGYQHVAYTEDDDAVILSTIRNAIRTLQ